MQKKKPYFQVIPNCSINGVTNWNESKEVPAEQGRDDIGLRNCPTAVGLFCRLDRHRQTIVAIARLGLKLHNPHSKWCGAIAGCRRNLGPLRQSCSLNIQAKYETLSAGRPDSLS
jgi:hypothetical protein